MTTMEESEGLSVSLLTDDASAVSTITFNNPPAVAPAGAMAPAVTGAGTSVVHRSNAEEHNPDDMSVVYRSYAEEHNQDDDEDDALEVDDLRQPEVELVGLYSSTNGRSCLMHECCGRSVVRGDLLRLIPTVVTINGKDENAVKFVRIIDGMQGCTVAFLPRVWYNLPNIQRNLYKFVIVSDLYVDSPNTYKRHKDHSNLGMAGCYFVSDIPIEE